MDRVGEGTIFVVYKVRDKSNNRVMALKAVKGAFAKNARFVQSLFAAAERTAGLVHPHLSRLGEVGEEDGTPFLVSEWLPGQSLEERLRRAPFGRAEALSFTRQIAEALHYLHQNGNVHGDLRPRQILSAADGNLKLTEAGLYDAFAVAGIAVSDVQQDAAYYLAPERGEGKLPAPGSDLYALGVILYRMLSGRVPFDGPSPLSIAMRHRKDPLMPPSQWNPDCPRDLEAIAIRLLEKDPQARYNSAGQLLRDLAVGMPGGAMPAMAPAPASTPAPPAARPTSSPGLEITPESKTGAVSSIPSVGAAAIGAGTGVVAGGVAAAGAAAGSTTAAAVGASVPPVAPDTFVPPARPARRLPGPDARRQVPPNSDEDDLPVASSSRVDNNTDDGAPMDEAISRKKQRKREARGALLAIFWLFVAFGLLGGIVYGAYYFWKQETPREVMVGSYLGKSRPEAERILARDGLRLVVSSEVYDRRQPADTVIKGEPPPGKRVRSGR
ncbi:MAG TPA: serine/threonine protein kinase, partial [Abditibacteriaceae bacterium]